jgi:hypothetical protein
MIDLSSVVHTSIRRAAALLDDAVVGCGAPPIREPG